MPENIVGLRLNEKIISEIDEIVEDLNIYQMGGRKVTRSLVVRGAVLAFLNDFKIDDFIDRNEKGKVTGHHFIHFVKGKTKCPR